MMKMRFTILLIIITVMSVFVGCGKTKQELYNEETVLHEYLEDSDIRAEYENFQFEIQELTSDEYGDARYYITASSLEYDLASAEEIVHNAWEKGIRIYVIMGKIETLEVRYSLWDDEEFRWSVMDISGRVSEEFENPADVTKEQIEEFLEMNNGSLLSEDGAITLLVQSYNYVEGEQNEFVNPELFIEHCDEIIEIGLYEGANNKFWYAPVDYVEEGNIITFFYENGKTLIIDVSDMTTSVGTLDLEDGDNNGAVSEDEIYSAVINTYNNLADYINGNENAEFNEKELRIIAENIDIVDTLGVFEAPITVEEYDSMREGPVAQFYYDGGASIMWVKDTGEIIVLYE